MTVRFGEDESSWARGDVTGHRTSLGTDPYRTGRITVHRSRLTGHWIAADGTNPHDRHGFRLYADALSEAIRRADHARRWLRKRGL